MLANKVCLENYTTFSSCKSLKLNIYKMKNFKNQASVLSNSSRKPNENLIKCIRDIYNILFYIIA